MKKLSSYLFIALMVASIQSIAQPTLQTNDFRIGGYEFTVNGPQSMPCNITSTPYLPGNNPSSMLNTMAQDGFNCVADYNESSSWTPVGGTLLYLSLVSNIAATYNSNFKIMCDANAYYKPLYYLNPSTFFATNSLNWMNGINDYQDSTNPSGVGYNAYPFTQTKNAAAYNCVPSLSRPDYNTLFNTAPSDPNATYTNPNYSSYIWGYSINEEATYNHGLVYSDGYYPPDVSISAPVPISNVSLATGTFRTWLGNFRITSQKMCTVQANHGKSINALSSVGNVNSPVLMNSPNPQDFIDPSKCTNMPDVFFESSYYVFPHSNWYTQPYSSIATGNQFHYLGKFKSIDYALTKVKNVQAMNDVEGVESPSVNYNYNAHLTYQFHSNNSIQNANYLWLLTYGSIIHGASGTWFWGINQGYTTYPISPTQNIPDVNGYTWDINAQANMLTASSNTRFTRLNFPYTYLDFVSPLSQELAYLVSNNLISTDPTTVVAKKTDQADVNCIVPPVSSYINIGFLYDNNIPQLANNYTTGQTYSVWNDLMSENYGLRYTIRTNGARTIMIISNMLPIALNSITLNFANSSNPIIENANEAQVLFETTWPSWSVVNLNTYKTNRNAIDNNTNINLTTTPAKFNTGAGSVYTPPVSFTGKSLTMSFGPLDTHVIEFVNSTVPNGTAYVNDYANGWKKQWSNNGSGQFGGAIVQPTDQILVGDFIGDGTQQIMDIQKNGKSNAWATILKYGIGLDGSGSWQWIWSNNGNGWIGGVQIQSTDQFIAGNFDGSKYDGILSIQQGSSGNYAVLQNFKLGTWNWLWSNSNGSNASNTIGSWNISAGDKYMVGDFTNSGSKQLFCVQNSNSNASASILTYSAGNGWSQVWSNSTTPGNLGGWGISSADTYVVGNILGNGNDRVLVSNNTDGWAGIFYYNGSGLTFTWTNGGNGSIAGASLPQSSDAILMSNLSNNSNNMDDMLFIQGANASGDSYATTIDLINGTPTWEWSNHNSQYPAPENGYINDWPVADPTGSVAKYFMFRPVSGQQPALLALRSYGCNNNYLISMYTTTGCTGCSFMPVAPDNKVETGMSNMKVYPNPNSGVYTIEFNNTNDNTVDIEVYNLLGQVVKTIPDYKLEVDADNLIQVNMGDVPSGQYIVKCISNNTVRVGKVVINK